MASKISKIKSFFSYQDLTRNTRPIITMLIFAIPLFISAFVNSGISLINSIVLRTTVGGDSVTAINQTAPLSALILQFGFGCTAGFGVVIANLYGTKNEEKVKKAIFLSIVSCFVIWLILGGIGILTLRPLLNLLNVNELYYEKAYIYFALMLAFYIFNLLSNLSTHILRALGNSFVVLISSLISMAFQIGICFLLTSKSIANLDIVGAAIAMACASLVNGGICYYFIFKKYRICKKDLRFDGEILKDMAKIGLPLGFQWSVLYIGTFVLASQVNLFGVYAAKGMAVYSSCESFAINTTMSTTGLMMSNFVGQNYGKKQYGRIKKGILDGYLIVLIIYLIQLAVLLPMVRYVPYIYLPGNDVNERVMFYSSTYLYITISMAIFQGLINISRGALQGMKKPLFPFISGIGELIVRIGVSLLIPFLIDNNYQNTLSDPSYIGISFATGSAWFMSFIIMGTALIIIISKNNEFKIVN